MSSSDPTSNLDSLDISTEPMDVPAAVGEAASSRRSASSTPRRARSKSLQGQGQGRRNMSQVIKSLPKVLGSGRRLAVASTGHEGGLESQPSQLPSSFPSEGAQTSVHNTFEYHDQRSQQVHVGVDPMVFSSMVSEARRDIQESEEKAQGLEQLAQEVYQQACSRIHELVNLTESLYQSDCTKASEIEKLQGLKGMSNQPVINSKFRSIAIKPWAQITHPISRIYLVA